jgi:hypothetical protein
MSWASGAAKLSAARSSTTETVETVVGEPVLLLVAAAGPFASPIALRSLAMAGGEADRAVLLRVDDATVPLADEGGEPSGDDRRGLTAAERSDSAPSAAAGVAAAATVLSSESEDIWRGRGGSGRGWVSKPPLLFRADAGGEASLAAAAGAPTGGLLLRAGGGGRALLLVGGAECPFAWLWLGLLLEAAVTCTTATAGWCRCSPMPMPGRAAATAEAAVPGARK